MADIFLSYQKRDRILAQRVCAALRERGMSVWWDDEVTPKESWHRTLQREIDSAGHILVLWTANSITSDWVINEASVGLDLSKLVQARFDGAGPPVGFRHIQYVDLDRDRPEAAENWQRLLKWLGDTNAVVEIALQPPLVAASTPTAPGPSPDAPPPSDLPVFYNNLTPLSSSVHARFKVRESDRAPHLAKANAIPLTIDEFGVAQRHFPIVFSSGETPVPLALMGLNDGVNVFVDDEGRPTNPIYIPAYVRRYPYLLAKLDERAEELSLCYDPTSDLIGEQVRGEALFDHERPTETLNSILKFCEEFEVAAQRTSAFVKELQGLDLLIDGEVTIQPEDAPQPFVYRGFRMVDEAKMRTLSGDLLSWMNENGMLGLVFSHLLSLPLIREIFGRQQQLGKVPRQ
ncbi:MAG TPA: SapC family protein [Allosphingosinicella sp.]|nr:SapC family protein [Allosphingosinicella sp.]